MGSRGWMSPETGTWLQVWAPAAAAGRPWAAPAPRPAPPGQEDPAAGLRQQGFFLLGLAEGVLSIMGTNMLSRNMGRGYLKQPHPATNSQLLFF